jgi:hypothetical protein
MKLFKGNYLDVRKAPEPDTILWENLGSSLRQRLLRIIAITITLTLLLGIAIVVNVYA